MAIIPSVTIPTQMFAQQITTITQAAALLQTYVETTLMPRSQVRTDASINTALGPHVRPTDWQTPKQRGWWWKFGVFLWHGRKAKQDWMVKHQRIAGGGVISAVNPNAWAKYVFTPPFQQRMHVGVWMTTQTYSRQETLALTADVSQAWFNASTGRGVVRIIA